MTAGFVEGPLPARRKTTHTVVCVEASNWDVFAFYPLLIQLLQRNPAQPRNLCLGLWV